MIMDWFDRADSIIARYINRHFVEVQPEDLGINRRAAYRVWVNDEAVAIPRSGKGSFDYYAGAEYIDKADCREYGNWVIYLSSSQRVQDWIDCYRETQEELEDASDS